MKYIIYRAINEINNKIYIGQTCKSLLCRQKSHMNKSVKNPVTYFHKAIAKNGIKNFKFEIIDECNSKVKADILEIHYIKFYNSFGKGYNLTLGGEGSLGWVPTEPWLKKQRELNKGKNNPMYGKSFVDYMSEDELLEYKKKMSILKSGPNNPMLGKTGSKCKTSKSYVITTPENEEIMVKGLREFCRNYTKVNLAHNYLSYCAKGYRNSYKGFKCRYL